MKRRFLSAIAGITMLVGSFGGATLAQAATEVRDAYVYNESFESNQAVSTGRYDELFCPNLEGGYAATDKIKVTYPGGLGGKIAADKAIQFASEQKGLPSYLYAGSQSKCFDNDSTVTGSDIAHVDSGYGIFHFQVLLKDHNANVRINADCCTAAVENGKISAVNRKALNQMIEFVPSNIRLFYGWSSGHAIANEIPKLDKWIDVDIILPLNQFETDKNKISVYIDGKLKSESVSPSLLGGEYITHVARFCILNDSSNDASTYALDNISLKYVSDYADVAGWLERYDIGAAYTESFNSCSNDSVNNWYNSTAYSLGGSFMGSLIGADMQRSVGFGQNVRNLDGTPSYVFEGGVLGKSADDLAMKINFTEGSEWVNGKVLVDFNYDIALKKDDKLSVTYEIAPMTDYMQQADMLSFVNETNANTGTGINLFNAEENGVHINGVRTNANLDRMRWNKINVVYTVLNGEYALEAKAYINSIPVTFTDDNEQEQTSFYIGQGNTVTKFTKLRMEGYANNTTIDNVKYKNDTVIYIDNVKVGVNGPEAVNEIPVMPVGDGIKTAASAIMVPDNYTVEMLQEQNPGMRAYDEEGNEVFEGLLKGKTVRFISADSSPRAASKLPQRFKVFTDNVQLTDYTASSAVSDKIHAEFKLDSFEGCSLTGIIAVYNKESKALEGISKIDANRSLWWKNSFAGVDAENQSVKIMLWNSGSLNPMENFVTLE